MRWLSVLAVAAVAACSSTAEHSASPGGCEKRDGIYRVTWVRRSGDCPDIPEQLVTGESQAPAGCSGSVGSSADACRVTIEMSCPAGTTGERIKTFGVVTWTKDAHSGSGEIQYTSLDAKGATACFSLYDVTYTKR